MHVCDVIDWAHDSGYKLAAPDEQQPGRCAVIQAGKTTSENAEST